MYILLGLQASGFSGMLLPITLVIIVSYVSDCISELCFRVKNMVEVGIKHHNLHCMCVCACRYTVLVPFTLGFLLLYFLQH